MLELGQNGLNNNQGEVKKCEKQNWLVKRGKQKGSVFKDPGFLSSGKVDDVFPSFYSHT